MLVVPASLLRQGKRGWPFVIKVLLLVGAAVAWEGVAWELRYVGILNMYSEMQVCFCKRISSGKEAQRGREKRGNDWCSVVE